MITDISRVDELMDALEGLYEYKIQIGIFGDMEGGASHGEDDTVLDIAITHEFGLSARNIPERSFIRAGYDTYLSDITAEAEKLINQVVYLKLNPQVFFETLGHIIVGFIQRYLTDLDTPPNAPATIALKGSSNPLIDTGQLRDSIQYKVTQNV